MPEVKTNTAMQELIDFGWKSLDSTPLTMIRFAERLLEKEKEEMINAWDDGCNKGYTNNPGSGKKYYNETFNK